MKTASLALILGGLLAVACARRGPEDVDRAPPRTLILSAFQGELAGVLRETRVTHRFANGGHVYHVGILRGQPVVLSLTGVGLRRARAATEEALRVFPIDRVVFVGVAGGLDPELGVGDVLVASTWAQHDGDGDPTWYPTDERLASLAPLAPALARCETAPPCSARPRVAQGGRAMSGSTFLADPARARRLWGEHAARVVDMETSAVASIAAARHLPFLAIRAVSDVVATGESDRDFERFWPLAAANASRVAIELVERLGPAPAVYGASIAGGRPATETRADFRPRNVVWPLTER